MHCCFNLQRKEKKKKVQRDGAKTSDNNHIVLDPGQYLHQHQNPHHHHHHHQHISQHHTAHHQHSIENDDNSNSSYSHHVHFAEKEIREPTPEPQAEVGHETKKKAKELKDKKKHLKEEKEKIKVKSVRQGTRKSYTIRLNFNLAYLIYFIHNCASAYTFTFDYSILGFSRNNNILK